MTQEVVTTRETVFIGTARGGAEQDTWIRWLVMGTLVSVAVLRIEKAFVAGNTFVRSTGSADVGF